MNEYLLKDAAKILKINYSTAKTIIRIFRLEKRIEKMKNSEVIKEVVRIKKEDNTNAMGALDCIKKLENQVSTVDSLLKDCAVKIERDKDIFSKLFILLNNFYYNN
jgi:hypothetical protein